MSIVEIYFEAKCKHCRFAKSYYPLKKDGTESKLKRTKCSNKESMMSGKQIKMSDKACLHLVF